MKTGAVILATEHKSEQGQFRPMVPIGDTTVIKRIIVTLKQAGADPIVVITGRNADELEKHISKMRAIAVRNEKYESCHMYLNVLLGLNYLEDICDRILILPAKFPMFLPETISQMMKTDGKAVCPVYNGRRGHPTLIDKSLIPFFKAYSGEDGLRGVMRQPEIIKQLVEVPVKDEGIIQSIECTEDVTELLGDFRMALYPISRLYLEHDDIFFGPGVAQLLSLIDYSGSMQTACRQMHMSYSKGWKMIKAVEKQMGYPVLLTKSGGQDGGFSQLTPKMKVFLENFLQMEKELQKEAVRLFEMYFSEEKENETDVSGD